MTKRYSKEFKEKVVQYYHDHEGLGYLSVARVFDIPSDETVRTWIKKVEKEGSNAFDSKPRKSKIERKKQIKKNTKPISADKWEDPKTMAERIAFLEAENAYIKKLIQLREEGKK
ncbi:Transposase [Paraliobacillus sp. PM-2]|uniref:helix-turn-helix domain-containing protein n=1 Tax=Paraliobacillus sp. PM-2 TaxID=1462524 RepID=UPI00061BBA42|nr:helix-turn-helix domain-containing protein [Paraliobacillus sp. PM-2]CQR46299.1 Transposase [Paraliobacillus sp. PM-2]CQR46308.1 Transposase [Paraliobacillus sp. PM-2]CQR47948.1 Transposase [Paraliobacillus sp. PM-2]